jgi:long-chain acyl-CoA synthetase
MIDQNKFRVDESKPWFSEEAGWPKEVPKNFDFPDMTLGDMLREAAKKWPGNNAVWFLDKFMTYKELDDFSDRLATAYANLGVKKGDVIALMLPNSFQYVIGYYASQKIGAIISGVNPTYKPMEIKHQLNTVGAKVIVCLDALYEGQIAPIIDDTQVEKVIITNIADHLPLVKRTLGKMLGKIPKAASPAGSYAYSSLIKTAPNVPSVDIDVENDPATYIMTGGTTGVPKAAVLTHLNCVGNAIQSGLWLYKGAVGVANVGILPLFHSFAMTAVMNVTVRIGGWMMLFPRPPEMGEYLDTLMRIAPPEGAFFCGAEVLFQRMANFERIHEYNLEGKLTLCISGAGPLHRPVQEAFEKVTGARLVEGFGLTETSPVISAGAFWGNRKVGSIGLPFPGTEWKVVDAANPDKLMPVADEYNEENVGELLVAGPQIMKEYLNRTEETKETIIEMDGKRWLLTGDLGWMDTLGRVYISDRKKQLIKHKGFSVFPKEVEELVGGHSAVNEVAVSGIPNVERGEIIKAWVVLKPDYVGKITEEELVKWCKENMTHYKVPAYIEFKDELPKTLVGKVLRRELQEADQLYIDYYKEHPKG